MATGAPGTGRKKGSGGAPACGLAGAIPRTPTQIRAVAGRCAAVRGVELRQGLRARWSVAQKGPAAEKGPGGGGRRRRRGSGACRGRRHPRLQGAAVSREIDGGGGSRGGDGGRRGYRGKIRSILV